MTKRNSNRRDKVVSRSLLKQSGVKAKRERDKFVFVIPADYAETLEKNYSFSFDQLKVGGDIPLPELAVHIDEQASMEASVGLVCEISRYALEAERNEYENWYNELSYKCKKHLYENGEKAQCTELYLKGYIALKHKTKLLERQNKIRDLEFQYRLLNNVFRSALERKGELLPTLRNVIQGKTDGIGSIDVRIQNKTRIKLKV